MRELRERNEVLIFLFLPCSYFKLKKKRFYGKRIILLLSGHQIVLFSLSPSIYYQNLLSKLAVYRLTFSKLPSGFRRYTSDFHLLLFRIIAPSLSLGSSSFEQNTACTIWSFAFTFPHFGLSESRLHVSCFLIQAYGI